REMTALLGHPLAAFGRPRAEVARLARALEIGVLRVVQLDGRACAEIFAESREAAAEPTAHPAQKAIRDDTWEAMAVLWDEVAASLAPLRSIEGEQAPDRWVAAHRAAILATAAPADPTETDKLDALFDALAESGSTLVFDAVGYGILFGRLAGEMPLETTDSPHPRLAIYGLLEARLLPADVVLLGGLDETIWPPQARSDAFLNRPMRAALGLSSPERRIGQTAHDFAQAMGHQTIVISRARKRGGSPTVASRFLLRLEALAEKVWDSVRARGAAYVEMAHALDRPLTRPKPATRPCPRPEVALRPTRLSVTRIETLRRDPYAIFASHVLNLAPLPQLGTAIDFSELGSRMHDALHAFAATPEARGTADARHRKLDEILRAAFAQALRDPNFRAFLWASLQKAAEFFLSFDAVQRERAREIMTETTGRLHLTLADGSPFVLSARADRVDLHRDGSALLVDYKTGQPPGLNEVRVGFAPQLTLEAAILRRGGFGMRHDGAIAATYVKLGGREGGKLTELNFREEAFDDVVERHFEGAQQLLSAFRNRETGYPSRPFPKFAKTYGEYDHLARVREWSLAGEAEA
ncbi:MAG: PD-(D/E)XK nuclease family protein, partial [Beijerinckiaceae bacterium]|nr:PD-(D/E)XK nuclease family protein [Beijerinckiaceae bacterium]